MIDFAKPIETSLDGGQTWKPARVLGKVNYENAVFSHIIAYVGSGGFEHTAAVGEFGVAWSVHVRNSQPKVIGEAWVLLTKSGNTSHARHSRADLDEAHEPNPRKDFAYFVTKKYDDGSYTNEIIKIEGCQ